jgi:hypothetical protein
VELVENEEGGIRTYSMTQAPDAEGETVREDHASAVMRAPTWNVAMRRTAVSDWGGIKRVSGGRGGTKCGD